VRAQGYTFYVGGVVAQLASKQVYLVRQEHLHEDLLGLGGFLDVPLVNRSEPQVNRREFPRSRERVEDPAALAALRKRLQFEYDPLERLRDMALLWQPALRTGAPLYR
jgi:hypothetical protein